MDELTSIMKLVLAELQKINIKLDKVTGTGKQISLAEIYEKLRDICGY